MEDESEKLTEVNSQSLEASQVQSFETAQLQLLGRTFDDGGTTAQQAAGDDNELAAFERELAELEEKNRVTALNAEATISAAPMTAEEIAAHAREEQSAQRGKRDVEIEAERDESASAMADEFDEMDYSEARLRRLRERREALRAAKGKPDEGRKHEGAVPVEAEGVQSLKVGTGNLVGENVPSANDKQAQAESVEDDEYEESGDERGFADG
ncbi:hypothetical protein B0A55_07511 [Friedmanniomyces simplex]|uniref:Uncharacterized protein n=1 Tax=Friedmanniomyces simplex TaxID=329884 RepID=A0A4U0Y0G8_9PEZI|nr:hypothetical protein B0A55_07511 [Friedmanniomyces simplex]